MGSRWPRVLLTSEYLLMVVCGYSIMNLGKIAARALVLRMETKCNAGGILVTHRY